MPAAHRPGAMTIVRERRRSAPPPPPSPATSSDAPFVCPRHTGGLRIAPRTCAEMFLRRRRASKHDDAWVRLWPCAGCEIGARHAGVSPPAPPPPPRPPFCARCGRDDLRLVAGRLCVGCYNRQREALAGRNRRGSFPIEHRPLYGIEVTALRAGNTERVRIDGVVGLAEAVIVATRCTGTTAVSLRPAWPHILPG
jgi:hypothetical protein